ncbi:hypothetical protein KY290_001269 [Solanum tuberosum]|uniref:Uncharacterized protein n=1 Tax=Solanum tuberosum TaxID=4113 RepID=A0ABQ7WLM2_SOLTU|nr:hypothetical protein KY285_001183 [Solanum tuberosum]KAH0781671.1 hypothetical protein KY290_001269 [Solanum tuberosum]
MHHPAAWGMSASRRKAHFSLWVIRRAALSDQGPGHKGPGTIQVRRTPEVTAMNRNLTHGPKRRGFGVSLADPALLLPSVSYPKSTRVF